jgi:cytochrome c-type biogenesis protein CcmH/NrfG
MECLKQVLRAISKTTKPARLLLMAGVAAVALSACASNQATRRSPDYSGQTQAQSHAALAQLSTRYKANPRDKGTIIHFAAALRSVGQSGQAVAVLQEAIAIYPNDADIKISYAKALTVNSHRLSTSLRAPFAQTDPTGMLFPSRALFWIRWGRTAQHGSFISRHC